MINKLKTFGTVIFVSLLYCSIFGILFNPMNQTNTVSSSNVSDNTQVPVITYHVISNDTELSGEYIVTTEMLEDDIKYLKSNGYDFISEDELINNSMSEKPILLVFDDGLYNSYAKVTPILKKCGAKGISTQSFEEIEFILTNPLFNFDRYTRTNNVKTKDFFDFTV